LLVDFVFSNEQPYQAPNQWQVEVTKELATLPSNACVNAICLSNDKSTLFVAERYRIHIIDIKTGKITATAGTGNHGFADGTASKAQFGLIQAIVYDNEGHVFPTDTGNNRIRCWDLKSNAVTTLVGNNYGFKDDMGQNADFKFPCGVVLKNDELCVVDIGNCALRCVNIKTRAVTTLCGGKPGFMDGSLTEAQFRGPQDLAVDPVDNLLVADQLNHRVRHIDLKAGIVTTLIGNGANTGPAANVSLIYCDKEGNIVLFGNGNWHHYEAKTGNYNLRINFSSSSSLSRQLCSSVLRQWRRPRCVF
jgi:hypothetical protein